MERHAYLEMADVEDRHWWFCGRRSILRGTLHPLLSRKTDPRILELGAGTGGNLRMLRELGDVTAVERDEEARRIALEKTGIAPLTGSLPNDLPTVPRSFDAVCLFDVLEHVDDDVGTLRTAAALTSTDGAIVLTVPANPRLWSHHDAMLHHRRRYTGRTLRDAATGAGLAIDRLTHFNTILYPVAWGARKLTKVGNFGASVPTDPVNAALTSILEFEAALLRHTDLPFGLSLLAVLRHA
jgi:SAM-dependent methyltransferase